MLHLILANEQIIKTVSIAKIKEQRDFVFLSVVRVLFYVGHYSEFNRVDADVGYGENNNFCLMRNKMPVFNISHPLFKCQSRSRLRIYRNNIIIQWGPFRRLTFLIIATCTKEDLTSFVNINRGEWCYHWSQCDSKYIEYFWRWC